MRITDVTTKFEMSDGRILKCEYAVTCTFDKYEEAEEPKYFIDDNEVSYHALPKGLSEIADILYITDSSDYGYYESDRL